MNDGMTNPMESENFSNQPTNNQLMMIADANKNYADEKPF